MNLVAVMSRNVFNKILHLLIFRFVKMIDVRVKKIKGIGCNMFLIIYFSVVYLPSILTIFLQKKIVYSGNRTILKSIGNFVLLYLLQATFVIGLVFIYYALNPSSGEAIGWLIVMFLWFSPIILLVNLIILIISHYVFKKGLS